MEGEEVATCPSCSLIIKIIYDPVSEDLASKVAQSNKIRIPGCTGHV